MTDSFVNIILKIISDYKTLLRRVLTTKECSKKITNLGLKRTNLRNLDDIELYNIALKIITELNIYTAETHKNSVFYSGAAEFLQYLKELLGEYSIEDGKLIHASQNASCAILNLIQIITLPHIKNTKETVEKIIECIKVVAKHGNKEQKTMFTNIIKQNEHHLARFFRRHGMVFKFDEFFNIEKAEN